MSWNALVKLSKPMNCIWLVPVQLLKLSQMVPRTGRPTTNAKKMKAGATSR